MMLFTSGLEKRTSWFSGQSKKRDNAEQKPSSSASESQESSTDSEMSAPTNEGEQIAQLFKRVRVHVKENPIRLSAESTRVPNEEPFSTTAERLNLGKRNSFGYLRKRRSSDVVDELSNKLSEQCCFDDEDER